MPRLLRLSVFIAFLSHGLFILTARYRLSYDAYTHMLFANHYAENWFGLWETRWYTGFTVVSYPPLAHQLMALMIPLVGFDRAYAILLWAVTTLYPFGVFAFSRIFTGKVTAAYAALASAVLMPIYVTAHIFGQLPFLTSTLLALFSAASLHRYLREGGLHNTLLTIALYTTTMAAHHATLLVQPFLLWAVLIRLLLEQPLARFQVTPQHRQTLQRLLYLIIPVILTCMLVIFPFWQWGRTQTLQTPIDHLSRHNFLTDPFAILIFFLPLYGPFTLLITLLMRPWPARFFGLLTTFVTLCILGLGGTTPLPRLLFGSAWEWLTYDRFAFWAALTITPFFGILFVGFKTRIRRTSLPVTIRKQMFPNLTLLFFAATSLGIWFTPLIFPLQPEPIAMQPLVDFLKADGRSQYRYLTFGFGDQFARLNLLTTATTIDGSYHTARTLPELRESGVGQVDTSYWALNGMNAIVPVLKASGGYGVRWGFVNPKTLEIIQTPTGRLIRSPFVPVLEALGWQRVQTLPNGIWVYENPQARIPDPVTPPANPPLTAFAWGTFPLLAFCSTLTLGALRIRPMQAMWGLRKVHLFLVSLLPIAVCFWFYIPIAEFTHPRVYFTYDHALFFFSDAVAVGVILVWLGTKVLPNNHLSQKPGRILQLLLALCIVASLSTLWSADWRTSLYIALHGWLVLALALSLRDWSESWHIVMLGLCAALALMALTGFLSFALQSTAFLENLPLRWPGTLDPSMRGVSIIQLDNGLRLLRAYGTLPHPNILGGFLMFALLGPASLFLEKGNRATLFLFAFGVIVLILTFSRAAWLGAFACAAVLALKSRVLDRRRLHLLLAVGLLTALLTTLPLRSWIFTRLGNQSVVTEHLSINGRTWLMQQALDIFQQHPLTGVGVGAFIIQLAQQAPEGGLIEPVHNILLLAGTELGVVGILLMAGLILALALGIRKASTPRAILASAALTGLGVIGLFDHYLWSLAPGRVLLGLAIGLWLGQVHDES